MTIVRIGIIGDYNPSHPLHPATTEAIKHTLARHRVEPAVEWLATDAPHDYSRYHAFWCSPGSPYSSLNGALEAIRWARERRVPFIGTCAGFQHAVLELALNVLGIADAMHAEYDPDARVPFIRPLSCSLAGKILPIRLKAGSLAASLYEGDSATESYYCCFGLNPGYYSQVEAAGMVISGRDDDGEARIVELADHPFFLATLFVPQAKSAPEHPHPLIAAFCVSALAAAGHEAPPQQRSSAPLKNAIF